MIGSVGGGNHFAELQYVASVHDRHAAYAWGFELGQVVLMVHSGSLSLGHQANADGLEQARRAWPARVPKPDNKILPILLGERNEAVLRRYLDAFGNAANFAVGNRFFLSLMLRQGLAAECGALSADLVYDAPHNLLWRDDDGSVVHRKGATPAGGYADMAGGPYAMWGEPVIVPGSMGAASYVLRGHGNPRTLASACHGAGRRVPRGAASRAATPSSTRSSPSSVWSRPSTTAIPRWRAARTSWPPGGATSSRRRRGCTRTSAPWCPAWDGPASRTRWSSCGRC
ncbi:RtcB family protein [Actinomadura luteofluorescens]|uniref:RtcB family protein n=1 Tax=Actinomadura luteofluorescens TaxID=46163 RepID=UPI003626452A